MAVKPFDCMNPHHLTSKLSGLFYYGHIMRRDFRLYELSDDDFEDLCVKISVDWLGEGVTPFAPGPDGGRDGKFTGKANKFPSESEPLEGMAVLQAKHSASPIASYSDTSFQRALKKEEYPRIKKLVSDEMCEHYTYSGEGFPGTNVWWCLVVFANIW